VYGGLVLILQLANYISYLDLGVQTAIAKYIAEHDSRGDHDSCSRYASCGVAIMLGSGALGVLLSFLLSLSVPRLFPHIPFELQSDVASGVLFVGASASVMLVASPFAALFMGLQRYTVPTFVSIANKLIYAISLIFLVLNHASLRSIGICVAAINSTSALVQVAAWKIFLPHLRIAFSLVRKDVMIQVVKYCLVLGFWTTGILIITGLDTTVVGHFDFGATAYYAIAATPLTFLGMLTQAVLNPMLPAISSRSVTHTASQLGGILIRGTRILYLVLQSTGLPLILFGYYVLLYWVGKNYAVHSLAILRILVLSHILRNLLGPYATMVIAFGEQRKATLSGLTEAASNLIFSIVLGRKFGALGVAEGTLIGAVVGVLVHLLVSFPRTQDAMTFKTTSFLRSGVLMPTICALPTILLLPVFWQAKYMSYWYLAAAGWLAVSAVLIVYVGLTSREREGIIQVFRVKLCTEIN
jgi:O-antigen/teichoic acid export membrane protein